MLRAIGVLLLAVFACVAVSRSDALDDLQPTCVCTQCKKVLAIHDEKEALLLGETYARIIFGEKALNDYKPLRAYRRERTNAGAYWVIVAFNSKRPPPDWNDSFGILLDEKYGCLLDATYEG